MPFFKDAMGQGNLYVKFKVVMPKRGELTAEKQDQLKQILTGPAISPIQKGEKVEYLEDFYDSDMNPNPEGGKRRSQHDDDDYEDEGGQRQ